MSRFFSPISALAIGAQCCVFYDTFISTAVNVGRRLKRVKLDRFVVNFPPFLDPFENPRQFLSNTPNIVHSGKGITKIRHPPNSAPPYRGASKKALAGHSYRVGIREHLQRTGTQASMWTLTTLRNPCQRAERVSCERLSSEVVQ